MLSRREFLQQSGVVMVGALVGTEGKGQVEEVERKRLPSVLIFFTDQQRWDTVGVYGSPMNLTPNLDSLARKGMLFQIAVTNQPVCAPARACLWTGMYQTCHGVWRNGIGLSPEIPTIAHYFKRVGYTVGYIGKWHLAPGKLGAGFVPPEYRGGFVDLWEAANVLEFTSHPYEGIVYDAKGKEIRFNGIYRTDFLTQRAIQFLREAGNDPFLLVVSYLEPHQQNDWNRIVAPEGYAAKFANPFVPHDLRPFPGDWQKELPDYYGCVSRLDENFGEILEKLGELGRLEDTIIVFTTDHGCHFRTRNAEYKRSAHESSVRIPLVIAGSKFNRSQVVPEIVSLVDVAPTLLDVVGLPIPKEMQGKSLLSLVERKIEGWRNEAFIQISESMVGRALRTERWKYCVVAPDKHGSRDPMSEHYIEWQLYDLYADPFELVNLAGRKEYREIATQLRERLKSRMVEAGEPEPKIEEARFYP
ncbi:MAG: sulfatase-like hydrolase/transferase [Armatimonadetes bacterium]|nr:sulfatase-like hydrolase/transferase [Armatimonadota bacterium]